MKQQYRQELILKGYKLIDNAPLFREERQELKLALHDFVDYIDDEQILKYAEIREETSYFNKPVLLLEFIKDGKNFGGQYIYPETFELRDFWNLEGSKIDNWKKENRMYLLSHDEHGNVVKRITYGNDAAYFNGEYDSWLGELIEPEWEDKEERNELSVSKATYLASLGLNNEEDFLGKLRHKNRMQKEVCYAA